MHRISSYLTFPFKFVLPGMFVVGLINLALNWSSGLRFGEASPPFLFTPIVAIAFLVWTFWLYGPTKTIDTDGKNLYISNYRTVISVAVSEIEDVRDFILSDPRRVTIYLRNETAFGRKIVFLAKWDPGLFFGHHPIVNELLAMSRSEQNRLA